MADLKNQFDKENENLQIEPFIKFGVDKKYS